MRQAALYSAILHLVVILVAVFGLPSLAQDHLTDQPIVIEVVTIAEVTNLPSARSEPKKPEPEAKPKTQAKPKTPPPPPPAPPEPKTVASAPPPPPEPKAKPRPVPKPEPETKPEAKSEPPSPQAKPKPPPKPKPKPKTKVASTPALKVPPKPRSKPKPPIDFITTVLQSVENMKEQVSRTEDDKTLEKTAELPPLPEIAAAPLVERARDAPLSLSELDVIRAQIQRCWNVPIGAEGIEDVVVEVSVAMNPDGSVLRARIVDGSRLQGDSTYRVVAESARTAVLKCSPLRMPAKKYEQWREMILTFNPKEMFGL